MSLKRLSQSVKSENADKEPCLGSGSSSEKITDLMLNKFSLEQPTAPLSGEARYLTPLWVSGNEEPRDELRQTDSSDSKTIIGFDELGIDNNDNQYTQRMLQAKIRAVLKLLTFRKQRVIVQFWSPLFVGKKQLLTTIDQPFGLGVIEDELCLYRKDSEHILYVVDKDHDNEEDISPPARVFKQGLPEWTSDIANYLPKHFAQQECAIRCNLHGYLALPVFDSITRSSVGVIEFLTSSQYSSLAYEAEQVQKALKTQNLTCLQVHDSPSKVSSELRLNELEKIFSILKVVCDTHKLPLAQTWAISPLSTLASHEQILKKRCGSFDTKCHGKVCMSTASLPYYVPDLGMWSFRKACSEQHLDMYRGLVGRVLLSRGSCFCEDVTKLGEEEYPLVHNAHMSKLTWCFAIFLHSVEGNHDYVLEFFLPLNIKDGRHVQVNLVQTLMQHIRVASGFELGDNSNIEVLKPLMDLPENIEPDIISNSMDVPDECSSTNVSMEIISATFGDTGETSSPLKHDKKRKRGSDKMVLVKAIYENIIKEFQFVTSLGLLKLKNEVAKQFKLNDEMIRLKYLDEEKELILICVDDDLKLALVTSEVNNIINLVCELSA